MRGAEEGQRAGRLEELPGELGRRERVQRHVPEVVREATRAARRRVAAAGPDPADPVALLDRDLRRVEHEGESVHGRDGDTRHGHVNPRLDGDHRRPNEGKQKDQDPEDSARGPCVPHGTSLLRAAPIAETTRVRSSKPRDGAGPRRGWRATQLYGEERPATTRKCGVGGEARVGACGADIPGWAGLTE